MHVLLCSSAIFAKKLEYKKYFCNKDNCMLTTDFLSCFGSGSTISSSSSFAERCLEGIHLAINCLNNKKKLSVNNHHNTCQKHYRTQATKQLMCRTGILPYFHIFKICLM